MSFGVGAISELAFAESTTGDGASITIVPTGVAATFSVGSVVLESIYFPTGVSMTSAIGTATIIADALVTPTGVSSTFSVGTVILESIYFPTGVAATFALGTATVTGTANVIPTGVEAVFAVGDLKLTIWNGVDDSATNTWTVVPTG